MANTYPEPYRSHPKDYYIDPSTCYSRECVSYTAWKIREITGKWPKRTGDMNAKNWTYRLSSWGYKRVAAPKAGGKYVGVLPYGLYGHVVWFESGTTVSEYNWTYVGGYDTRRVRLADFVWYEIKAPAKKPTPKPPVAKKVYHTVKKNEFLSTIAANNKTTVQKILAFPENAKYRKNPNLIYPGNKVRVK